jgi:hypothetical protein
MRKKEIAYIEFSKRLRMAATKKGILDYGLTTRIAEIADVNSSSARKWLLGEAMPDRAHAVILSKELDVSLDWLTANQGPMDIKIATGEKLDSNILEAIVQYVLEVADRSTSTERLAWGISYLYSLHLPLGAGSISKDNVKSLMDKILEGNRV